MTDDTRPDQEAILTLAEDRGQVSLAELSSRLETDFGTLFKEVEALIEAGELVRVNHFTYRTPRLEAANDGPPATAGAAQAAEVGTDPADTTADRSDRQRAGPVDGREVGTDRPPVDATGRGDGGGRISTLQRVAGGLFVLVGAGTVAAGAVGLHLVLIGGLYGVLSPGTVIGLVGDPSAAMAAGGAAVLVVVGGVVALIGWFAYQGRLGRRRAWPGSTTADADSPQAED